MEELSKEIRRAQSGRVPRSWGVSPSRTWMRSLA